LWPQGAMFLVNCSPDGRIFLWLTRDQAAGLSRIARGLTWEEPLPIPLSHSGMILRGQRTGGYTPP